jgi:hypothetical protein
MPRHLRLRNANLTVEDMKRMPARPGAARRLAQLPDWDGLVYAHGQTWSNEAINDAAQEALFLAAIGQIGWTPADCRARERDPNDPPAVGRDIILTYSDAGKLY